jgi:hypothetical protein
MWFYSQLKDKFFRLNILDINENRNEEHINMSMCINILSTLLLELNWSKVILVNWLVKETKSVIIKELIF